jgi:hypothetical protein
MQSLAKATLLCVSPQRMQEIWPHVSGLIRSAIERTGLSAFSDVEYDLLFGDALLWLAWSDHIEAVAATTLNDTDAGKVCIITACGGTDMHRWLPLLDEIEAYAKAEGCKRTRIIGRKGWLRVLSGYQAKHVIMDKELI